MTSKARSKKRVATDDAPLIATNDDAFQSKVAAMRAGYFEDVTLSNMADKYKALHLNYGTFRRPPVINRGTYARVLLKETLVEAFLQSCSKEGKVPQIISIGAGFDTHPFALLKNASQIPSFHYVELDFPQVVREKTEFVTEALSDQQHGFKSLPADKEGTGMVSVVKRSESVCLLAIKKKN